LSGGIREGKLKAELGCRGVHRGRVNRRLKGGRIPRLKLAVFGITTQKKRRPEESETGNFLTLRAGTEEKKGVKADDVNYGVVVRPCVQGGAQLLKRLADGSRQKDRRDKVSQR